MGTPVLQIPRGPSPTQSPDLIPSQHCVLIHLHADGVLGLCGGCAGAQVGATVPAASRGPPSPNTWQDGGQAEGCLAMFPPSSLLLQGQFCCHDLFLHGRGRPGAVDPPPAGAAGTEGVLFSEQSGMGGGGGRGVVGVGKPGWITSPTLGYLPIPNPYCINTGAEPELSLCKLRKTHPTPFASISWALRACWCSPVAISLGLPCTAAC